MKKRHIENSFNKRKVFKKAILKIIYVILYVSVLYNILFLINTTISKKEYFKILDISIITMKSESMKPELKKNDLMIVKSYKKNNPQIKDNISYSVNNTIKTNKVFNIQEDNGERYYVTKSNNNYYPDIEKIYDNQIIGKVVCNINILGIFINIIQSKLFTIFAMILILLKISYNKYMYKMKKERRRKKYKNSNIQS